jgi:hypothetical protein
MSVIGTGFQVCGSSPVRPICSIISICLRRESGRIAYGIEGSVREDCGNYQISPSANPPWTACNCRLPVNRRAVARRQDPSGCPASTVLRYFAFSREIEQSTSADIIGKCSRPPATRDSKR